MEKLTKRLTAALDYFGKSYDAGSAKPEDIATGEICNSIKEALELVEVAKEYPEASKEHAMRLLTAKSVADDCEELKIQETGNGFAA